ncbi:hypothetical protein [Actinoplanes subglobosus]|uniref:Uncharacterized protein n=1 Tax=Actinoplanes subglobosus TaxID=1547892 RepID=A0ABV8IV84_9ACTN
MNRADIPAGEVLARVYGVKLAWGDPSHFAAQDKRECRHGDGPTVMRDERRKPCHLSCAEKELAAAIAAERFGDLCPHELTQELTGQAEVRR